MRLLAQNFHGFLDISAPERLDGESWLQTNVQFRKSIKAGDVIDVPDEYLSFPNIQNAVNAGLLSILNYGTAPSSIVINAELSGGTGSSGISGFSGCSGGLGQSGPSGPSGPSGFSGYSGIGISGFSGYSGIAGIQGQSGISGFSGYSGLSGTSGQGLSGFSGQSGSSVVLSGLTAPKIQRATSSTTIGDGSLEDNGAGTLTYPAAGAGSGNVLKVKGSNAGSGDSDGGSVVWEPGAKSGGGSDGTFIVRQPGGTPGTDELQVSHDGQDALIENKDGGGHLLLKSAQGWNLVRSDGVVQMRFDNLNRMIFRGNAGLLTTTVEGINFQSLVGAEQANYVGGGFYYYALTPATITTDKDNYYPGSSNFLRLSSDATRTITGLQTGAGYGDKQSMPLLIANVGSNDIVLANESASSTDIYRFTTSSGLDVTIGPDEIVICIYDGTTTRWRVTPKAETLSGLTSTRIQRATSSTTIGNGSLEDDGAGGITCPGSPIKLYGKASLPDTYLEAFWSSDPSNSIMQLFVNGGGNGEFVLGPYSSSNKSLWLSGNPDPRIQVNKNGRFTFSGFDNARGEVLRLGMIQSTNHVLGLVASDDLATGATLSAPATTPDTISSDQNDYNPGASSLFQRWSSDAPRNLTGLTFDDAQVDGQLHMVVNCGTEAIILKHQDSGSNANNRIICPSATDLTLAPDDTTSLIYDGVSFRWRIFKS